METFEQIVKVLTPIVMGLLVVAKLYLELRKAEVARDSIIRGVDEYAKDSPTGRLLKDKIQTAARDAGAEESVAKAVEKVRAQ